MIGRVFGKRQQDSGGNDGLTRAEIDYIGGRLTALTNPGSYESRNEIAFATVVDHLLKDQGHYTESRPDFRAFPPHLQTQLAQIHKVFFGGPSEAAEATAALGPVWGAIANSIKSKVTDARASEKAAEQAAANSAMDIARSQIDLVELIGGPRNRAFRVKLLDWLKAQPADPDLWHDLATNSDPDGMDDIFEWIVGQPACDASTAAFIFHAMNAFELLAFADESAAGMYASRFRACATITRRWREGSFPTARFSFQSEGYEESLDTYREQADEAEAKFGAAPFDIPTGLFEFRTGERTRSRYFFSDHMSKAQYLQMLEKRTARN
ncbi:MAG TPA: DUF4274 domain-containing protein [Rhizobiaceae bacterium]|nr:DUF4274 domain-containing protein [Rhizobiaceae bacterium]